MKWLDGITDSMDMNREMVRDREAWWAVVQGVYLQDLATEQTNKHRVNVWLHPFKKEKEKVLDKRLSCSKSSGPSPSSIHYFSVGQRPKTFSVGRARIYFSFFPLWPL